MIPMKDQHPAGQAAELPEAPEHAGSPQAGQDPMAEAQEDAAWFGALAGGRPAQGAATAQPPGEPDVHAQLAASLRAAYLQTHAADLAPDEAQRRRLLNLWEAREQAAKAARAAQDQPRSAPAGLPWWRNPWLSGLAGTLSAAVLIVALRDQWQPAPVVPEDWKVAGETAAPVPAETGPVASAAGRSEAGPASVAAAPAPDQRARDLARAPAPVVPPPEVWSAPPAKALPRPKATAQAPEVAAPVVMAMPAPPAPRPAAMPPAPVQASPSQADEPLRMRGVAPERSRGTDDSAAQPAVMPKASVQPVTPPAPPPPVPRSAAQMPAPVQVTVTGSRIQPEEADVRESLRVPFRWASATPSPSATGLPEWRVSTADPAAWSLRLTEAWRARGVQVSREALATGWRLEWRMDAKTPEPVRTWFDGTQGPERLPDRGVLRVIPEAAPASASAPRLP